jgi:hypothetical protein
MGEDEWDGGGKGAGAKEVRKSRLREQRNLIISPSW